jgi:hypothetical protein
MTNTTLNAIREHSPCEDGWEKLLKSLGKTEADDEPLPLVTILDSNGIEDAVWCLKALGEEHQRDIRLFNCDIAEGVLYLFEEQYPDDKRPRQAIETARRYALGKATKEELDAAMAAAWDARNAAWDAARVAAWAAAWDARNAAWDAAMVAAWAAAWDAARVAGDVARAVRDVAGDAAAAVEKKRQARLFIKYFGKELTND